MRNIFKFIILIIIFYWNNAYAEEIGIFPKTQLCDLDYDDANDIPIVELDTDHLEFAMKLADDNEKGHFYIAFHKKMADFCSAYYWIEHNNNFDDIIIRNLSNVMFDDSEYFKNEIKKRYPTPLSKKDKNEILTTAYIFLNSNARSYLIEASPLRRQAQAAQIDPRGIFDINLEKLERALKNEDDLAEQAKSMRPLE